MSCSQVLAFVLETSQIQGSMTGQEVRDALFARLFGITAIIQSGLLVRAGKKGNGKGDKSSDLESYESALSELIALGEKKSWLREGAWWSILLAMEALYSSGVRWKNDAIKSSTRILFTDYHSWSPEKIALTLKLQKLDPDLDWQSMTSPTFKSSDLFKSKNLPTLARILKVRGASDYIQILSPNCLLS